MFVYTYQLFEIPMDFGVKTNVNNEKLSILFRNWPVPNGLQ